LTTRNTQHEPNGSSPPFERQPLKRGNIRTIHYNPYMTREGVAHSHYNNKKKAQQLPVDRRLQCLATVRSLALRDGHRTVGTADAFPQRFPSFRSQQRALKTPSPLLVIALPPIAE